MNNNTQRGISLIEVLIAFVIVTVVLLGMMKLQWQSLHRVDEAWMRTRAVNRLLSMAERLQIIPKKASISQQQHQWQRLSKQLMPDSQASINCSPGRCRLHLQWKNKCDYSMSLVVYR